VVRRALTAGLAVLSIGAVATGADAATLKVSVPRVVHKRKGYTITISGRYKRSEVRGRAYLIAAIQFSAAPCQKTALLENNLRNAPQFYFGPQAGISERKSPFTRRDGLIAKASGPRHVCAYLYPHFVGPTSTTTPITTADASYRVVGR
jgi:hypothetical protein